jgi:Right handed beta helix region
MSKARALPVCFLLTAATAVASGASAAGLSCSGVPATGAVTSNPISCTVACASGGTVASALALAPRTTAGLTITIQGICAEQVDPLPGNVTLQGAAKGDGLRAPSTSTDPVLGIGGQNVTLTQLTITGGVHALHGHHGASFAGTDVVVEGGTSADLYLTGASAELTDSTIESSAGYGIQSGFGSVFFMHGGVVENNAYYGVSAFDNGEIDLEDGAVVQKNTLGGGYATEGGAIQLYGGSVQDNGGAGFYVQHNGNVRIDAANAPVSVVDNAGNGITSIEASTATVANGAVVSGNGNYGLGLYTGGTASLYNGGVVEANKAGGVYVQSGNLNVGANGTIKNNGGDGILLETNSVADFSGTGNAVTGNKGWGIYCAPPPGDPLIEEEPGLPTLTGNERGGNNCKTAGE